MSRSTDKGIRENTTAGKIAWWIILGLVAAVPILMANGPLAGMGFHLADGFDGVKVFALRIGVMALLAAWIWDVVMNGGEIRYHRIYILLGILLVWIAITTVLSINPATAFLGKFRRYDGAWSYMLYALLFFLTMQYATSVARVRQLAQTLSWSSVVVAAYGILQAIGADPLEWGPLPFYENQSFSTYGNPNLLAGFLAFSIFVNLGLVFSEDRTAWRRWYWIVLLMNSVVAITAFSRSLWVAAVVAILVFAVLMWRQKAKGVKEDWYFAGGAAAVVAAVIGFSLTRAHYVMNFWNRIQSIFEFDQASALTRFQIWDAAMQAVAERPIFGYGLDTFRLIFRRFAPAEYAQEAGFRSVADNVHNFPLQLATGIGIIGVLLFYALLFWVAYIAIRSCWKASSEGAKAGRVLFIGIVSACIAYCVHLFFGLSLPGVTFLLWIFMGVLMAPSAKMLKVRPLIMKINPSVAKAAATFATILLLVPCVFATRLLIADHVYAVPASFVATQMDTQDMDLFRFVKAEARRTVELNPFYERYYADYFALVSHYALVNALNNAPNAEELIENAKVEAQHLIDMSPWEYDSHLAVANFYINLGEIVGGSEGRAYIEYAVDFTRDQIELTPHGLALRARYAEALILLGEIDAGIYQLEFVVAHDPNYLSAIELLEHIIENPDQFNIIE